MNKSNVVVVLSPDDSNADWLKELPDRQQPGKTARQVELEIHDNLSKGMPKESSSDV